MAIHSSSWSRRVHRQVVERGTHPVPNHCDPYSYHRYLHGREGLPNRPSLDTEASTDDSDSGSSTSAHSRRGHRPCCKAKHACQHTMNTFHAPPAEPSHDHHNIYPQEGTPAEITHQHQYKRSTNHHYTCFNHPQPQSRHPLPASHVHVQHHKHHHHHHSTHFDGEREVNHSRSCSHTYEAVSRLQSAPGPRHCAGALGLGRCGCRRGDGHCQGQLVQARCAYGPPLPVRCVARGRGCGHGHGR